MQETIYHVRTETEFSLLCFLIHDFTQPTKKNAPLW